MGDRASQRHLKIICSFGSIQGRLGSIIVVTRWQVSVHYCFELLNLVCRVLDGAFDALEFIELIGIQLGAQSVTQFAATQTNDAQLIHDIVGDVVDDRRLNLDSFLSDFAAKFFNGRSYVHIASPNMVLPGSMPTAGTTSRLLRYRSFSYYL